MKQLLTIVALLIGLTPIASISASENLSVDDAKAIIWKMKYKDICTLHKAVFLKQYEIPSDVSTTILENRIDMLFLKAEQCIDKAQASVGNLYKTIRDKLFGKSIVTRVQDTLKSASLAEQEDIKDAIFGSYKEYELDTASKFVGLLFVGLTGPFGLLALWSVHREHIKEIEAQRAQFQEIKA